jgi:predicted transcriptional regulator
VKVTTMTPQANTNHNMSIEDALCSKTKMKILLSLRKGERLNTSQVARRVCSGFQITRSILNLLEEQGILTHSNFGCRSRIYRFSDSPRAKAILELLEAWER